MGTALNHSEEDSPGSLELEGLLSLERFRLTRDGFSNISAYFVTAIAGMVLVPVLLTCLSREMYGLWIAALAVQYSSAFLSAGLGRCVAREVATGSLQKTVRFVVAVSNAYLLVGTFGALAISAAGVLIAMGLHISPHNQPVSRLIFGLAGLGFFSDQVQSLAFEILTGLRRFLTINAITSTSVILRTVGIIILLRHHSGLIAVASFHVLICIATGIVAYAVALRLAPQFRPRLLRFGWSEIRDQMGFSLASQFAAACTTALWRSAPFLIGILRGAAAIVPYELGQKFPMSISSMSWQAADVLFPAASEYHRSKQDAHTRQLLELGTRGVLFFTLPFCLMLWILAPQLLATWVGSRLTDAVWILRIITFAILVEGAAAASIQILWGQGKVKWGSIITFISTVVGVAVSSALIVRIGVVGAAIGIAAGVLVGSIAFMSAAARLCHCRPYQVLLDTSKNLALTALFTSAFLFFSAGIFPKGGWPSLALTAALSIILYVITFYCFSAHSIEKNITRGVVLKISRSLYSFYSESRQILEKIGPIRWAILYAVEIKNTLLDSSKRDRVAVERLYRENEDPFGFNRNPEQFRFQRAIEILQAANSGGKFARALEIGCAEGMFTRMLAQYCDALVAVDLSSIALERAIRHCSDLTNVEFAEWDVRQDPVNGRFDLIVATGVLEYVLRPTTMNDIRERITAAIRPGGYLLLGNTVSNNGVEKTWIGRKLIRGALINDYFANDTRYETIAASLDQCVCPFAHILLRKRGD